MMDIAINSIPSRIGIETQRGVLNIKTSKPQYELKKERVDLNIRTQLPQVEIDQREAFASMGLKTYYHIAKEAAMRGHQRAIETIGKIAMDGDRLAAIELGGNPIADIAERDAFPEPETEGITMPIPTPDISVKPGRVIIDPVLQRMAGGVNSPFEPGRVSFNYTPAQVRIYMKQYPSINISYTGASLDRRA